ncbi:MAG: type IV secretion system DNA-binding domain-containing protein [Verrucomicrobiota bacterium]
MNDQPDIIIGERHGWGDPQPFGMAAADRRQHVYIIGKTGSGKTTLLRNLIIQHITLGHGVGLIDPHGDLAEELLHHIPPRRADHLVYFNPGDLEYPIGLNLLANVRPDDRHLVASGIVGAFKGIWRDSWGPRLEYILYNAVVALLDCQNVALLGVNRMLVDERYRATIIRQVKDPFIRSFWAEEYAGYDARFQREAIAPIQNKLGQFLLNPVIRNILGQVKTKVSIPFVMDNGRLFIANLSKGQLGHDKANLLGSLLVTQFQLGAMARATKPEADRRDFYLFIDEFQNFTTDAFASILAEARKYRLCLTLSHQYIDQLALPIRQGGVWQRGNAHCLSHRPCRCRSHGEGIRLRLSGERPRGP